MSKLRECGDETTSFITALLSKYDVRLVLGVLGARFGEVASAALAAGVERRFVLEVAVGTLDCVFTPPEKAPQVLYYDNEESLGRKQ